MCGIKLERQDPKRVLEDGSHMVCPIHPMCDLKPLLRQRRKETGKAIGFRYVPGLP